MESKESRRLCTIRTGLENISNISVAWREQSWLQYKLNDEELRNGCQLGQNQRIQVYQRSHHQDHWLKGRYQMNLWEKIWTR